MARGPEKPSDHGVLDLARESVGADGGARVPQRRRVTQSFGSFVPPQDVEPEGAFRVRAGAELAPHRLLCLARRPDGVASQQYRLLRFKLKEDSDPRVVGVTSASQGEGKTVAAANLGMALAEGHQGSVLLLDLNLRNPALGAMFGTPGPVSVADQLRLRHRDARARWNVVELRPRLHLMSGGGPAPNPGPLLNSDEMDLLVGEAAQAYDYVVADLPAVLVGADVKSLQDLLDGLVLVCRSGQAHKAAVRRAVEQLGEARVVGALLLGA